VVHGGDSGDIESGEGFEKKYIFEHTLEENRQSEFHHVMPTLRQVFELVNGQVFINIEVKSPHDEIVS
jgi:glycerophosphoryl diester phosphodiesterase